MYFRCITICMLIRKILAKHHVSFSYKMAVESDFLGIWQCFCFRSELFGKWNTCSFAETVRKFLLFPMSRVIPDSMIQKSNRHIRIFDTERLDCSYEQLLCLFNEIILLFLPNIPNRQPLFPCIAQRVHCAADGAGTITNAVCRSVYKMTVAV